MEMKKTLMFVFAIFMVVSGVVFVSAITGSISNGKMVLYPEVNGWTNTIVDKTIQVNNVNDVPINITLRLDSNSSEFIDLIDESFILEAGESKKAQIQIHVRKEGTYEGRVNVFFKPIEGNESGVVLSSTIVVIAKKDTGYEEEEEENTEEEQENTENQENTEQEGTTGPSKLVKFWGISTGVLLIILLVLLYIWGKKRKKSKNRRKHK